MSSAGAGPSQAAEPSAAVWPKVNRSSRLSGFAGQEDGAGEVAAPGGGRCGIDAVGECAGVAQPSGQVEAAQHAHRQHLGVLGRAGDLPLGGQQPVGGRQVEARGQVRPGGTDAPGDLGAQEFLGDAHRYTAVSSSRLGAGRCRASRLEVTR